MYLSSLKYLSISLSDLKYAGEAELNSLMPKKELSIT